MKFTGEQFVPGIQKQRLVDEHCARYDYSLKYAKNALVLDVACGTGYGCAELSKVAKKVTGVDISLESIDYAKKHFGLSNINFINASATQDLFKDESFDLICSFETIEHLTNDQREKYLKNLSKWLKPTGVLLLSTPNRIVTSPFTKKPLNVYHEIEFTLRDLKNEVGIFFIIKDVLGMRHVRKIYTYYLVRKSVHLIQRVLGKQFHLYDLANGPEILPFDSSKIEPRIFFLICKKK